MSTDLTKTTGVVMLLNEDSSVDEFGLALDLLDSVGAAVRELKEQWKQMALARVQKSGEMVICSKRFYAGTETVTKCRDIAGAAEAIFVATAGDWAAFVDCLASDCFKPGQTKKTLPLDAFKRVFSVEPKVKLATGEPRKKQLIEVDERFVKPRPSYAK